MASAARSVCMKLWNARGWRSAIAEGETLQSMWPGSDGCGLGGVEVLRQRQFGVLENARAHARDGGHQSARLEGLLVLRLRLIGLARRG